MKQARTCDVGKNANKKKRSLKNELCKATSREKESHGRMTYKDTVREDVEETMKVQENR